MFASKTFVTAPRSASISGPKRVDRRVVDDDVAATERLDRLRNRPLRRARRRRPSRVTVVTGAPIRATAAAALLELARACGRGPTRSRRRWPRASTIARPMPRVPPVTRTTWPSRRSAWSGSITGSLTGRGPTGLRPGRRDRVDVALAQDQVLLAADLDLEARCRARTARGRSASIVRTVGPAATTSAQTSRRSTARWPG